MDCHQNARLTLRSRELLIRKVVEQGCTLKQAAACFSVSAKTAAKWVRRYREQGPEGLRDRSSRPHRLRRPTPAEQITLVEQLRRQRWTGLRIAQQTGLSRSTISRILRRLKLSRIRDLEPKLPVQRYEHAHPGDLLHLDIKQLGRIARPSHRVTGNRRDRVSGIGWEYLHVAIDDHSRIAFSAIYPDEKRSSVLAFLAAALDYYARFGIRFRALLTDNGPAYRSRAFARACRMLGLKHRSPVPIHRAPTARRSGLSRPPCGNGPMPAPIRTQTNAARSFAPGYTSTTGTGPMVVSAGRRPSADQLSIGTTC